jgi:hypothetical protein
MTITVMRALTDGEGAAYYLDGQMLVVLSEEPAPPFVAPLGKYVPLNAFTKRTIVRKHK